MSNLGSLEGDRPRTRTQPLPADLSDKRVLSTSNAAALCGLSVREWERLRAAGKTPPPVSLGSRKLGYQVQDLLAWIDARKREAAA